MANTGSVTAQMTELLDTISKETRDAVKRDTNAVAKECVQKLRANSPRRTGSYASGWAVKKEGEADFVVHNKTDYQLTHLLENGHVIRNKRGTYGRVPGTKHIKPVEDWAIEELPRRIMEGIP